MSRPSSDEQGLRFRYRAVTADGTVSNGVVVAPAIESARSKLVARRLLPIALDQQRTLLSLHRRISDADLAVGTRILADLLGSGLPVRRALQTFDYLAPASWKRSVPKLLEAVRGGASLSAALQSAGADFPPLLIGLVRAGEAGAGLAPSLAAAAATYEASAAARATLRAALTYPAFLLVACTGSVALLAGVVLPRFATLLGDLGQQLPASAAALLRASVLLREHGPMIIASLAIAIAVAWALILRPGVRRRLHAVLLGLPIVGDIRHALASASVCGTTGALVQAGVTVPTSLQHAAAACGDVSVAARVLAARTDVIGGARTADALGAHQALTRLAVQLLRAGEEAGNVSVTLDRAAQLERARATRMLQTAFKFVEPVLVIVFGAVVAFIAAALLEAVYTIRPTP